MLLYDLQLFKLKYRKEYIEEIYILKKTISGKITTYTYDSANQLVSSVAPDGKITNYAYDAAGRMIKEGDKTYEYGWLDKVLKVTENGKTLADFEYHNNGQIAKAIRPDKTENFLWDGLALVKRDDTKFINEPHAGGGNPVLVIQDVDADKSKAIFTDMLGTSLGSTVEDQYNNITKTSFGADTTDTSAFFTGKPYINELGYAFLFRNYRADTGKWLSQDLIGYPDGWNSLKYSKNQIISSVDWLGAETLYIGGALESRTGCLSKGVKASTGESYPSKVYGWDQKDEVINKIKEIKEKNPSESINLVGHSYGGDTAYLVARDCGYSIDSLVTLDPVSHFTSDITKPSNVNDWTNVVASESGMSWGDVVAGIGGAWGEINASGVTNIDATNADHEDVQEMLDALRDHNMDLYRKLVEGTVWE